MFEKTEVNGVNSNDVFKFLRCNSSLKDQKTGQVQEIPWNFAKFLVNAEGQVVHYHGSKEEPRTFENEIKQMLGIWSIKWYK